MALVVDDRQARELHIHERRGKALERAIRRLFVPGCIHETKRLYHAVRPAEPKDVGSNLGQVLVQGLKSSTGKLGLNSDVVGASFSDPDGLTGDSVILLNQMADGAKAPIGTRPVRRRAATVGMDAHHVRIQHTGRRRPHLLHVGRLPGGQSPHYHRRRRDLLDGSKGGF